MIECIICFIVGGLSGALIMALCVISKNNNIDLRSVKWTQVSERLPEEPLSNIDDLDELPEYIAMIEGASMPTVLTYSGHGVWYRDENYYRVIAWMPLPEAIRI